MEDTYEITLDTKSNDFEVVLLERFPDLEIEREREMGGSADAVNLIIGSASLAISVIGFIYQIISNRSDIKIRKITLIKNDKIKEYSAENLSEKAFVDLIKSDNG